MDTMHSTMHSSIPKSLCTIGVCLCIFGMVTYADTDEVTVMPFHRDVPAARLTCWTCQHSKSSPNQDCISMRNKTNLSQVTCHLSEPFCRVRKLMNDGHVEMIERSCTHDCDPGCEKKINKVQACTACCVNLLCNTGSDANMVHLQWPMFGLCLFVCVCKIVKDTCASQFFNGLLDGESDEEFL